MGIYRSPEEMRKDYEEFVSSESGPSYAQLDFLYNDQNPVYLKHRIIKPEVVQAKTFAFQASSHLTSDDLTEEQYE